MCTITEKLKTIIDPNDPQDRKLFLLAQLVSTRFSEIKKTQEEQGQVVKEIHTLISNLAGSVKQAIELTSTCPVHKEREKYETITFLIKRPIIAMMFILGLMAASLLQFKDIISDIINMIVGAKP